MASGSRKRLFKDDVMEVDRLNSLSSAASSVQVHGAVTSISLVKKKTCNFFDGKLADESSAIQMVGFNAHQQKNYKRSMKKRVPVELSKMHAY